MDWFQCGAGDEDGESLELAFSKKKVEQRKAWLKEFVPGTYLDHDAEEISYTDFVHKELILFSRSDLLRSIPSMLDGLKPGQRKILFTCFQKNQKKDIKVCELFIFRSRALASSLKTKCVNMISNMKCLNARLSTLIQIMML